MACSWSVTALKPVPPALDGHFFTSGCGRPCLSMQPEPAWQSLSYQNSSIWG
jgi:hypothetical protein